MEFWNFGINLKWVSSSVILNSSLVDHMEYVLAI